MPSRARRPAYTESLCVPLLLFRSDMLSAAFAEVLGFPPDTSFYGLERLPPYVQMFVVGAVLAHVAAVAVWVVLAIKENTNPKTKSKLF